MDRGAWEAIVHGVTKSWTRFTDYTATQVPLCILSEEFFNHKQAMNFVNNFSMSIEMIIWFLFFTFIHVVFHTDL